MAAGKLQVLFDLNILLDVLQERKDFYDFSARLPAYAENRDFEDAVQMMAALQIHSDYLLTRNVRDYQPALMEVVQPVELLALLQS